MNESKAFFDTNVLLYLLSGDETKADRAEEVIASGGVISVQVLNEFASVTTRKLGMSWVEVHDILSHVRAVFRVEPITEEIHDRGLLLSERYGFAVYDAMIIASALLAQCTTLYSEDMQNGQVIDDQLTIRNPFAVDRYTP
jgi:predicted nucleic acid-binding protein